MQDVLKSFLPGRIQEYLKKYSPELVPISQTETQCKTNENQTKTRLLVQGTKHLGEPGNNLLNTLVQKDGWKTYAIVCRADLKKWFPEPPFTRACGLPNGTRHVLRHMMLMLFERSLARPRASPDERLNSWIPSPVPPQ
jgi:hypothetical protein